VKHFLILTDGIAGDAEAILAYTADLAKNGITTSTVAVGEDSEQSFLEHIAIAGQGHHHDAARVAELPRIVLEGDARSARAAPWRRSPIRIQRLKAHEVLAGVDVAKPRPRSTG